MSPYNLDGLGAEVFEDLVVSLCLGVLGPGVTAFGAGPDGGREATFRGPIHWSATVLNDQDNWDGYTVIQAKYRAEPSSKPTENAAWLRRMIDSELDQWADPDNRRTSTSAPHRARRRICLRRRGRRYGSHGRHHHPARRLHRDLRL